MVSPGIYDAACSQKTPRKNSRNESNISMKKYHQSPTFGVRSGRRSRTPYVAARKSHEPVMKADAASNAPIATARPKVWAAVKDQTSGLVFVFVARVSYRRTIRGGKRSIGCMERYAAKARAKVQVMLAPWEALAMAVRTNRLVKAEVDRAMHVAIVKGLKRKLSVVSTWSAWNSCYAYPAAMARLLHLESFRDDVNRRVTTFCPLSAICAIAMALRRSTTVYSRFVARGCRAEFGSSEKSGRKRGAWWYTPPS
jgi:hypothetical protein